MHAAYIEKSNAPIQVRELDKPLPGPKDMLVRLHFAALNHRDVWMLKGQYAGRKEGIVPGSDGAGIVEAVGGEVDPAWIGKEVIINPALDWGDEAAAQSNDFRILGNPDQGTFAGYIAVPAMNVHQKPAHLSLQEAAAIPLSGLTAFRACFTRGGMRASDTVLLTGIGGGTVLFALQFALSTGAKVYVTSSSQEKLNQAREMGASAGFLYTDPSWIQAFRDQAGGADLVIDSAAGPDFGKLTEIMNPGGRVVVFGQTAGSIGELPARFLFWKQLSILGSTMGSPEDFAAMLHFYSMHELKPVIDQVFPLKEAAQAFRRMEEGKQFGKIVLDLR